MTGPRTRLTETIRRATIGLFTVAALVVPAPMAAASPESDASDAINQAWDASKGDHGPLGPKDGDVYPVGDGFGQKFAGGKIFFTPATGAKIMQGAILEKYESLGGPADSDLGFPTIDEGAGKAPDSRNTTFSAGDHPVIFWTPATGARVVRGAINAAWDKLGGSAGALGVPAEDEAYNGDAVTQKFTRGEISWNQQTKAFTTVPPELADQLAGLAVPQDPTSAINAARRAAGGAMGPLGAKQGPQYPIGPDGVGQNFAGGKIFYSPAAGAHVVTGQVLAKYESVGGPQGDLGFPASSETDGGLASASRVSTFDAPDKPVIFWTPDYGAVIVRGAMNAAWTKLGGATGPLGAPVADQTENGSVITQKFSTGAISWNRTTKAFSTEPSNLAASLAGLQVPGEQPKAPPKAASNASGHNLFGWHWWWVPVIIGVLFLLIGLMAAAAALRNRRSGSRPQPEMPDAAMPATVGFGAAGTDDHGDGRFANRYDPAWGPGPEAANRQEQFGDAPVGEAPREDEALWLQPEPDDSDTAPNRIESDAEPQGGRHEVPDAEDQASARPAIHLPLDDPLQIPEGYPIKADTKSGQYWAPDSTRYNDARAEIWFASEEFARANGFVRGR
ncbi:hypothetical protein [Mycobacterium sp.]|jgi:uncharacterized protein with LGFP repeats|uniref:LGFP repeat-containing protein n=1 Tax=Mycobacterium sp. TaxID=1785 RepID=UPI002D33300D|nr:hypothetical protein [Mycobacterium sp.]HZA10430.1 hypothetical protein [Mycobacterium sp.]